MFKKCKHCNADFKGEGYFCSDVCEIKNHTPKIMEPEKDIITPEPKKEVPKPPTLITENMELPQVESDLKIKSKVLETPVLS